ncbi:DNA-binding protein Ikaros-like isoform X2 [Sardina pilchardus]|uniref:DNA-binding protein Ikaros-like isoform X2 n=1 Tax=Sardina pilchardus TaxID=27697 RepID=UPI002E11C5D6
MKDSPTQTVERDEDACPGEETMDLTWKGATPKVREEEEEEREEEEREEEEEEEEEPSRQTDPEENDRDGSESGGPEAESLVKTEQVDDHDQRVDDRELDGQTMDSEEAGAEKEDDSVDYGEEDMFIDAQDSPINYAKYDSPTPPDGGGLTGWNGSQRTAQGSSSKLTCDICGLACVSLNVLLVHKRSHTGERPFHCQQCGASFTQKGNLLRHIKLHSGEKPFKCPMCSYACRRRDALSGHLRTHSVEKPYKCNHCGRSYKQRSSLEEHRERCHVYMQSRSDPQRGGEEVSSNGGRAQGGVERAILLDRLASNVAKRKSTMPQKFVGETPVCLDLCFKREPGVHQSGSDPPRSSSTPEGLHGPPSDAEQPHHNKSFPLQLGTTAGTAAPLALTNGGKTERGAHQPSHHHPMAALDSPQHPHLHHDGGPRSRHPSGLLQHHQQQQQQHPSLPFSLSHLLVPGVTAAGGLPFPMHHPHHHPPHLAPHLVHQPPPLAPPHGGVPPHEVLRVVQGKGEPAGAYMCSHCRVLFLDYVMFTIHMGCHGFRDPLECNLCGHLSRDRYEFSSHIARGEHYLEIK